MRRYRCGHRSRRHSGHQLIIMFADISYHSSPNKSFIVFESQAVIHNQKNKKQKREDRTRQETKKSD